MKKLVIVILSLYLTFPIVANAASKIPENLAVPNDQNLAFKLTATGSQIYECKHSKDDPKKFEWSFKAPEATLFDNKGNPIGKHYAGPTWELNDGSNVVGVKTAEAGSPEAHSIPWLLLNVKSHMGDGKLSEVKSIQRIDTLGGQAPNEECTETLEGKEAHIKIEQFILFTNNNSNR